MNHVLRATRARRSRAGAAHLMTLSLGICAASMLPLAALAQDRSPTPTPFAAGSRDIGMVLNGTTIVFDQPPIDRDGRLYVPLRGIFERLGASVVFDRGLIAATAGTHTVGLRVGEGTATVDGAVQALDAPPILLTGRTLVPLRFISQALGAKVDYDASSRLVSVTAPVYPSPTPVAAVGVASASQTNPVPPGPPAVLRPPETPFLLRLLRAEPAPNSTVARRRPEISATFAENVDARSLRIALDGTDLTPRAVVSARSFVVDPGFDLSPGPHDVTLVGQTPDREAFNERWTFTTRDSVDTNYLSGLEPANGALLGSTTFSVNGFTQPRSRVRVVATTSRAAVAFGDSSDASATTDTIADARGYFNTTLVLSDRGSGLVDVRVLSKSPGGNTAVRTLRLRL